MHALQEEQSGTLRTHLRGWIQSPIGVVARLLALGTLVSILVACGNTGSASTAQTGSASTSTANGKDTPVTSAKQPQQWSSPPAMEIDKNKTYTATLHTTDGDIVINLLAKEDPITVNNFVFLAQHNFYNNVPFHRIIKGFMIQTGDPTGTGAGGPGYKFQDEPVTRDYTRGTVAMANSGPNTNGSQFFIVQADMTGRLPKNYTIFGEVTQGMDVVDKIANTPVTMNQFGEQSQPTQKVQINSVDITVK